MANQIDLGYLCGETKRKRKVRKQSSSTGGNKGRPPRVISYCPECPIKNMADPELAENVLAPASTKTGKCRQGHQWQIGGASYPTKILLEQSA